MIPGLSLGLSGGGSGAESGGTSSSSFFNNAGLTVGGSGKVTADQSGRMSNDPSQGYGGGSLMNGINPTYLAIGGIAVVALAVTMVILLKKK
jgi:hypothetical protein